MANILIEQIRDSWCDEGHKSEDLVKIKIGDKDFQLCSKHLDGILTDRLGDVAKLRGLPVIDYSYSHNDRGEFHAEKFSVQVVGVSLYRDYGKPTFNVKNYPKLQKVIDLIKGHNAICLIHADIMDSKYDSVGETERKLVPSKDIIDFLEGRNNDDNDLDTYLSNLKYTRKTTDVDEDDD